MDIHIKWNGDQEDIQIPVNPSSFSKSGSQNNTSLYIHDLGEINLKGKRGLYSTEISSFFPAQNYDFCQCEPGDPYDYYVKTFQTLYEDNTTVHLVIAGTSINYYGTIETFTYGEEDRSGDVAYSMMIREQIELSDSTRTTKDANEKTVKWKKNDTWQKLTKKHLGSSSKWRSVRSNNKKVINKANKAYIKSYKKSHSGKAPKKTDEKKTLIGYKVVMKA